MSEYVSDGTAMEINLEHWEGYVYITSSSGGAVTCNLPAATEFHNGGKIEIDFTKVSTNLSIVSEQGVTTAVNATDHSVVATSNGLVWTMS